MKNLQKSKIVFNNTIIIKELLFKTPDGNFCDNRNWVRSRDDRDFPQARSAYKVDFVLSYDVTFRDVLYEFLLKTESFMKTMDIPYGIYNVTSSTNGIEVMDCYVSYQEDRECEWFDDFDEIFNYVKEHQNELHW